MTTPNELVPMIIPTVMIPLTLVSVGISVVASFIAALFGIELKMEGPKKLLEVLLKPKVLASAFMLNAVIMGGIYCWKWWNNYPRLISTIESQMNERSVQSDVNYPDRATVLTDFQSLKSAQQFPSALKQVWRLDTGAGSFRAATISSGRVFTGNRNGIINEVDLESGKVIRTFYTGTMVSPELTIWQNSLYVGEGVHDTHHARVYRFDLKSGKLLGSYQTLGHTEGQAVVGSFEGENTLFVVAGADSLHAVDPLTMKLKWKSNPGHTDAGVVVDDRGSVFLGTGREKHDDKKYKSYATALHFKTGEVIWKKELPASSWMRPVILDENVCFVSGEVYFPTERGHLLCFDRKTGAHTAAVNASNPLVGTPKVLDKSILYTSLKGEVCRFDIGSRSNLWCFDTKMKDSSFAGASYDPRYHVVLYPSIKDGLYVLDAESGKLLLNWKPAASEGEWMKTVADVAVTENHWVISDYENSVRAVKPLLVLKTAQEK